MREIEIIRSNRKTISIEIKPDMRMGTFRLIVRAPIDMSAAGIERFISEKSAWIEKHLEAMRSAEEPIKSFTESEIRELADKALEVIPPRAAQFAKDIGVNYCRLTIRNQVSRWGSCSSQKALNFNCLLMLCPEEVVNYVIIHELCHLRHMNHSKEFWAEVEKYCPEYREHKKWLKDSGSKLIRRLRHG